MKKDGIQTRNRKQSSNNKKQHRDTENGHPMHQQLHHLQHRPLIPHPLGQDTKQFDHQSTVGLREYSNTISAPVCVPTSLQRLYALQGLPYPQCPDAWMTAANSQTHTYAQDSVNTDLPVKTGGYSSSRNLADTTNFSQQSAFAYSSNGIPSPSQFVNL